ncbi:MAG: glycosyltransferase [Sphingobacteriales bacterium]|nr:MAG: glycosyltransferase [Sphingobacteriales bacterium]
MRILFLYAEVTGYLMACLQSLQRHPEVSAVAVYQGLSLPENDYQLVDSDVDLRDATHQSAAELWPAVAEFKPDVVFVSGWMFRKYHILAKKLRKTGATLVIGNDTPWYGSLRQWAGAISSPWWITNTYQYMWVPGISQYEFARRLGFPKKRIATGLLSADADAFSGIRPKAPKPVKTLLAVGSFLPNKGMHRLYQAFSKLLEEGLTGWDLHLVGSGPLYDSLTPTAQIRLTHFQQPGMIPELYRQADAFALASLKESWGVVIHEAACAGLPLLVTQTAGATADLVHNGYNGFVFDPHQEADLLQAMRTMLSQPEETLRRMGERSKQLSQIQHPDLWAQRLVTMRLEHLKTNP